MTRTDILKCAHEPFGDAYYFGPERLAERYEDDEKARSESGFADSTFQTIFDRINADNTEVCLPPLKNEPLTLSLIIVSCTMLRVVAAMNVMRKKTLGICNLSTKSCIAGVDFLRRKIVIGKTGQGNAAYNIRSS